MALALAQIDTTDICRLTRGMRPEQKARWIWDHTDIRPEITGHGVIVPSLSESCEEHCIETRFRGMRPYETCSCPATVDCWAIHLYRMELARTPDFDTLIPWAV